MEFVILTGFMLLFFIMVTIGIQNQMLAVRVERNEQLASQIASVINNEVVTAEKVNEGYSRTFVLPPQVDGSDYQLSRPTPEDLIIDYRGKDYLFFLDGNATITPLKPGINTIRN